MNRGRHRLLGVPHADLAEISAMMPGCFRQRRRKRSCLRWQLLFCRFLRGQRRLDLLLRLPRPRRNQCTPRWSERTIHSGHRKCKNFFLREDCMNEKSPWPLRTLRGQAAPPPCRNMCGRARAGVGYVLLSEKASRAFCRDRALRRRVHVPASAARKVSAGRMLHASRGTARLSAQAEQGKKVCVRKKGDGWR